MHLMRKIVARRKSKKKFSSKSSKRQSKKKTAFLVMMTMKTTTNKINHLITSLLKIIRPKYLRIPIDTSIKLPNIQTILIIEDYNYQKIQKI